LLFFSFGLLSEGTVNDDDIGRFLNTRAAFRHPEQFVSLWNRPAFVILYAIPAQLGYWAVELITALVAALTCYLVYRAACARQQANAFVGIPFVAFQPQFFLLSFSALVEPLAALLLAASLQAFYAGRLWRSAIFAALMPLARIELSVILAIWGLMHLRDGRWRVVLVFPLGLLAWNIAGALVTGDPLFLYNQVFTGEARIYRVYDFWHYPATFIFIVGPVVFAFALVGLLQAMGRRKLEFVHYSFLAMFLTYIWLSWKSSAGQAAGFLRHFVAIAPLTALIAVQGFHHWLQGTGARLLTLIPLLATVVLTGLFFSRDLAGGLWITGPPEHSKLVIVGIIAVLPLVRAIPRFPALRGRSARTALIILAIGLGAGYLAIKRRPIALTQEQQMIQAAAAWYCGAGLADRVTLCNHGWFRFFNEADHLREETSPALTMANLERAPLGAIAVWDAHYAHRLHGDVQKDYFSTNRQWYVHRRFHRPDGKGFFAVALERVDGRGSRTRPDGRDLYENAALGIKMDLANLAQWRFELREDDAIILRGAHLETGLQVNLAFDRSIGQFTDTVEYASVVGREIDENPEAELLDTALAQGDQWGRARFLREGHENAVWFTVSPRQGTTLRVHFRYPPGQGGTVADAMVALVESLDMTGFY
jgi:hypothetical protein